jgi:hypothetical protein
MPAFVTEYPQFFAASINGWYKLLEHDQYKDIIANSLRFLVEDKLINLYAFVIMPDHIHLIRQMQRIKYDLQKFTRNYYHILKLPPRSCPPGSAGTVGRLAVREIYNTPAVPDIQGILLLAKCVSLYG